MTVIYSCNECGKEFNFRIKLNRHIAIIHGNQNTNKKEPDFLKAGVNLTDDEKVAHFDNLREIYFEILEKISSTEEKFDNFQKQLKVLEKSKTKPKRKRRSEKLQSFKGFDKFSDKYEDIEDDTIPEGWKSATKDASGLGKGKTVKLFWAPNGKCCASRRRALYYMAHELKSSREDIEKMSHGLFSEGWKEDPENLPKGWMYKIEAGPDYRKTLFLSPDFQYCKSTRGVLKILLNTPISDEQMDRFICKYVVTRSFLDPSGISWMNIESLPFPWRIADTNHKGKKGKLVVSPTGQVFTCSKTAKDYLDMLKDISAEEKEQLYSVLGVGNLGNVKIDNCALDIENQKENDIENGRDEDDGDSNDKKYIIKKETPCTWIVEDKYAPPNWKTSSIISTDNKNIPKRFRNPTGTFFRDRIDALKHMLQSSSYTEDDLQTMKKGLIEEDGWKTASFLPEGWMRKEVKYPSQNKTRRLYLTPTFDVFKTLEGVLSYMKENGVPESDILKFKEEGPRRRENVWNPEPDVNSWLEADFLPEKWLFNEKQSSYRTPCGKNLSSMKSVVGFMIDNKYAVEDIEHFKENSKNLKFKDSPNLPEGWKQATVNGGRDASTLMPRYLSPDGIIFNNRAKAIQFMLKNGQTQDKIEKMKEGLKDDGWEFDKHLPTGWMSKDMQSHNPPIYLSPSFDTLRKKKDAINYMIQQGCHTSEIKKLKDYVKNKSHQLKVTASSPNMKRKIIDENEDDVSGNKKQKLGKGFNDSKDETILPEGWREIKNGSQSYFISSEGERFDSRLSAVKFLIKSNTDSQTTFKLWSTLDQEGWVLGGELLPAGWRVKFHKKLFDYKYLTREMEVLGGSDEALKHITDNDEYTIDSVEIFKKWVAAMCDSLPKIKWIEDTSLPEGWRISSGLEYEIIKNNHGGLFEGRKEAIESMIKNHHTPKDIFKMWNTLHLEGWISDDENLPIGWKRKFFSEQNQHHYLSPMMEVISSSEAFLKHVSESNDYKGEVWKVEQWIKMGN